MLKLYIYTKHTAKLQTSAGNVFLQTDDVFGLKINEKRIDLNELSSLVVVRLALFADKMSKRNRCPRHGDRSINVPYILYRYIIYII